MSKEKREYRMKQRAFERHAGKDHHSGVRRLDKKGGAGLGNWGKPGLDDLIGPSFEEDEYDEGNFFLEVREFTDAISEALHEYFTSADIDECAHTISECIPHDQRPRFVKKALHMSMDLRAYERELTSVLLAQLCGGVVSRDQISDGFQMALDDLTETLIDVPNAVDILSKFLARAILDEAIPPITLDHAHTHTPQAKEVITLARGLLNTPQFGPRLAHIWGPGDLCSVKRLVKECQQILAEYLITSDTNEALTCLKRLNAPSFHPRFVRELIRTAFERGNDSYDVLLLLLKELCDVGVVSQNSVGRGFQIVHGRLSDFMLDFPKAAECFVVVEGAV